MRLLGNTLLFAGTLTSFVIIGNLLPPCIFQYVTWIAHVFLCMNLAMWILYLIQDYFYTATVNPKNKAVLITGCDSGFGNSMAKIMDRRGYKIFACCLDKTSDGASELKELCSSNVSVIQMDVTDDESVAKAVKLVEEQLGKSDLWAIVNNAGVLKGFHTELSTMNDYEMCLQVNTLGMVRVTKAFLPMLRKSRGRVINICSLAGRFRSPCMGAYMMSKSAAVSFSEVLCHEMRDFGVRVISIEPEFFRTPMSSEKRFTAMCKESFTGMDEEVFSAYGKDYIEKAKKIYYAVLNNSSPDVKIVHDAVEASISLQNPAHFYRPIRNIYLKMWFMLGERSPEILQQVFLQVLFFIIGLPVPRKGVNFLSRFYNM